jgi:uracil-DNA glycosylase
MIQRLPLEWREFMSEELSSTSFKDLTIRVHNAYLSAPDKVFPAQDQVFRAFELCDLLDLKVVILGQDPYPTRGHAHGLCFSVEPNVWPLPKSLQNIDKERVADLGLRPLVNGDLTSWAKQGVLLLNTVLTVVEGQPGSHQDLGWEDFTSAVIKKINKEKSQVVFLLWGAKAQRLQVLIDSDKHLVLSSAHPSPLSAYRGFFGNKHFSKTNTYLGQVGKGQIQW